MWTKPILERWIHELIRKSKEKSTNIISLHIIPSFSYFIYITLHEVSSPTFTTYIGPFKGKVLADDLYNYLLGACGPRVRHITELEQPVLPLAAKKRILLNQHIQERMKRFWRPAPKVDSISTRLRSNIRI